MSGFYATIKLPKVILGQSVILAGFRPSQRLGSHEREITGVGREITFGTI